MVRPLKAAIESSTKPELVERVGMDQHLHVHGVGDGKAGIDRGGRRTPVLVELETAGARLDLLDEAVGQGGIALAVEAEVHGEALGRLQHAPDVPGAGRAGRGLGPRGGTRAAPHHRRDAAVEQLLDQLRANEMDVRIDPAGGQDHALARDRLGAGTDDDVDPRLHVGITGLADREDAPLLDADVRLHDAPMIEDESVGDDRVDGTLLTADLALAHAVADHLAAAELDLLAVDCAVLLDLDEELGVGKAHLVAHRGAEHVGIAAARNPLGHRSPLRDRREMICLDPSSPPRKRYGRQISSRRRRSRSAPLPLAGEGGARGRKAVGG